MSLCWHGVGWHISMPLSKRRNVKRRSHSAEITIRCRTVRPKPLNTNDLWLGEATNIRAIFQHSVGKSHATLVADLRNYEGDKLTYLLLRGLAAVLENRCSYSNAPPVSREVANPDEENRPM